jgi:hypothetical protein
MIALEAALNVNSQFEPLARWRWTELLVIADFCFCSFFDFPRSLIKSLRGHRAQKHLAFGNGR